MEHYDVLGVPPDATVTQIRAAYVRLAREHHPDRRGGSTERMQALNAAWAVLGDPDARGRYDLTLRIPPSRPTPPNAGARHDEGWGWTPPTDRGLHDLEDDRPIHGGTVKLPPWLAMVPPGMVLLAVVVFLGGLLLRLSPLIALGAVIGLLGMLCFLLSPFVALAASRRGNG